MECPEVAFQRNLPFPGMARFFVGAHALVSVTVVTVTAYVFQQFRGHGGTVVVWQFRIMSSEPQFRMMSPEPRYDVT